MQKIVFGSTDMLVFPVGMGGIPVMRLSSEEAIDLIRHAHGLGVNFFDTANMYKGSEDLFGRALEQVRGQVYFATKTAARDAATAKEHLALSLKQLRTDYIDLYQLHNVSTPEAYDACLAKDGALAMAQKAQAEGRVRYLGITCHNLDIAVKACESGLFASVQIPFSLVEHDPTQKLIPAALKQNMGVLAMKPFGGGLMDRADLCIGFLQQHPEVLPIPGIQAKHEIDEIVGLYENPKGLNEQDWLDIEQIRKTLGKRFCHRCEYCQPCPQEIRIPMALLFKAVVQRSNPERVLEFGRMHVEKVQECAQCGECEEKCPYNLPVMEMLQEMQDEYQEFKTRHGQAE
jgi:predicted aldo/keto reductase-like oxidoreductase